MFEEKHSNVPKSRDNLFYLTNTYLSKIDFSDLSEEDFFLKYANTYLKFEEIAKKIPSPKAKFR